MSDHPLERIFMTIDEYMALPESDQKMELIHGELITYGADAVSPAPKDRHGQIIILLIGLLGQHVPLRELRADNVDVHIDGEHVLRPDVLWASAESGQCTRGDDGYLHGAPDLAIEVLSPSTEQRDRGAKYDIYEAAGAREYWLVADDGKFIEVYRLEDGRFARQGVFGLGQHFASAVLSGAQIEVDAVLAEA